MIAGALGIRTAAWRRWSTRDVHARAARRRRGRPLAIDADVRARIRACYDQHYRAWGPQVLACWCAREGLGSYSATTIARVIADLMPPPVPEPAPRRYEVTRSDAVWGEDGAGFTERKRKKELLLVQDEHARHTLANRLADGPARENDVIANLEQAFRRYGAPLVLKHDGGKIFHGEAMCDLLARWGVIALTGPRSWPGYNGKSERKIRDVRTTEHALRRHGIRGALRDRLDLVFEDLDEVRPRPMLGGCTAREVYERDRGGLPDRASFIQEVDDETRQRRARARTRRQWQAARRHAIEAVLFRHGLLREIPDVSRNSAAEKGTK